MSGKSESEDRPASAADDANARRALECIQQAQRGLQFGEVRIILQDGVVVQVERLERKRIPHSKDD